MVRRILNISWWMRSDWRSQVGVGRQGDLGTFITGPLDFRGAARRRGRGRWSWFQHATRCGTLVISPGDPVHRERRAKGPEARHHSLGIGGRRFHEDIQIDTVSRERMRTYDEEVHFGVDERPEQVQEVLVELGAISHRNG
jgi:hypothetical protein